MKRFFPSLAIFAAVSGLSLGGFFSSLEYGLTDLGFRLLPRLASEKIVVVEIDEQSLQRLNAWPWPRRYHAAVVDRLLAAGATQVAIDIDFSSPTNPEDDRRLSDTIANAGERIVLPVFKQSTAKRAGKTDIIYSTPYAPFAQHARLATVNVRFAGDDRVRHYRTADDWKDRTVPSMASVLAAGDNSRRGAFVMDYGIQPDSIPRLSYVDVVTGNFRNDAVAGKSVIIGGTAAALGDQLAVPVFGVLPGPVVQAIAYESLAQNRAIDEMAPLSVLALALVVVLLIGPVYERVSWRLGLAVMTGATASCVVAQIGILAVWPINLSLLPVMLVVMLSYLWGHWRTVSDQIIPAIQHGTESMRHGAMMRGAVENSVDGIMMTNGKGLIEFINPAATVLFNLTQKEAAGLPIGDFVPHSPELDALLAPGTGSPAFHAHDGKRPVELETHSLDKGKRLLELTVNATRLEGAKKTGVQDHHGERVFIFTFRDITERKKIEDSQRPAGDIAAAAIA